MESCRNNADNIRYGTTARRITWSARYETAYIVEKQITVPFFSQFGLQRLYFLLCTSLNSMIKYIRACSVFQN